MAEASSNKRKIFDNRYEVLARVGRGSASVVYRAKQLKNPDIEVALKVLTAHSKVKPSAELLRKEALAMVSSRHPHVIRLNDFHSLDDICYLAMEYAREGDLRQYLKKLNGRLSYKKAELFLLQAASALNFVHNKARITHRDIKPENILVFDENNIRIGDFGVALLAGEEFSLEQLQRGVGTMDYMAPEVLKGEACDMRSDIYSLGVTFYELISGSHPFEGASLAAAIDIRKDGSVKPLKELHKKIPKYLSDIIEKCMRFDPEDRYPTAGQLVSAFNAQNIFLPGTESTQPQATPSAPPKPPTREPREQTPPPAAKMKKPGEGLSLRGSSTKVADKPAQKSEKPKPELKKPRSEVSVPAAKPDTVKKPTPTENAEKEASTKIVPFNQPNSKVSPLTSPKQKAAVDEPAAPKPAKGAAAGGGAALADRMRKMVEEHEEAKNAEQTNEPPVKPVAPTPHQPESLSKKVEEALEPSKEPEHSAAKSVERPEPILKPERPEQPQQRPEAVFRPQKPEISLGPKPDSRVTAPSLTSPSAQRTSRKPEEKKRQADSRQTMNILIGTLIAIFLLFLAPKLFRGSSTPEEQQLAQNQETSGTEQTQTVVENTQTGEATQNQVNSGENAQAPGSGEQQAAAPVFRLPPVKAEALQFPLLPGGLYIGALNSLYLKSDIPITILSLESRRELVVTLGIPGSRPTRIQLPADGSQKSFQIAANGFLYELTAQVRGDKIEGIYQNIITGEQGSWQLFPVRS